MRYTLFRLAPGSYDVLLDGVIVASLVRGEGATWAAELLSVEHIPAPLTAAEHAFESFEACGWLGDPEVKT